MDITSIYVWTSSIIIIRSLNPDDNGRYGHKRTRIGSYKVVGGFVAIFHSMVGQVYISLYMFLVYVWISKQFQCADCVSFAIIDVRLKPSGRWPLESGINGQLCND